MRFAPCTKVSLCLGLIAYAMLAAEPNRAAGQIVISQLFGGSGGNAAAANGDFVEIFNRSCVTVNLDAYSIQVASGGSGTTWSVVNLPNFLLDPGEYYCIRLTTTAIGTPFIPDFVATGLPGSGDLMLSSSGKAAIVFGNTPLPVANCPVSANIVDFAKYEGTASACTEGLSFGVALGGTAAGRSVSRRTDVNGDGQGDGCQDTNVNNNDFMSDTDPAVPRTNASGPNPCPGAPIYGGCNLGDGSCRVTPGIAACNALGGSYLGDCVACVAPQACCLPTTPVTCTVTTEADCQNQGGLFNPGQFACPPVPACPPLGRCCAPDGNCTQTFGALCVAPNTYGGDGTNCNGTPCQGRCCGLDGTCIVVGPTQCVAPSTFAGIGTNCDQPQLCQGRCCEPNGNCTLTGSTNCLAPNNFGGVGTTCADVNAYLNNNPEIIPVGGATPPSVITVPDGFTVQDVDVRVKIQHVWRADVVICITHPGGTVVRLTGTTSCEIGGLCGGEDNLNAIFDDEGAPVVCASANLASLTATPDLVIPTESLAAFDGLSAAGDWTLNIFDDVAVDSGTLLEWELLLDAGDACKGACCLPNTSCIRTGESVCLQQGGTFNGNGSQCSPSPCAPNGACCTGSSCSLQSAIDCGANNGVFSGVGTDCKTPPCFVPCCRQDGSCALMTAQACAALPFAVAGAAGDACPPAPCAPVGACCFEDGTCQAPRTEFSCTTGPGAGGIRWTEGLGCTPNLCQGRCCFPDGTCLVLFPSDCNAPNVYAGDGTNCTDPLACSGRCCSPDGFCSLTGPDNCQAPSVFAGIGTSCADPNACLGACCAFAGGECTLQGPDNCIAPDTFSGVGSNCAQVQCSGRCCQANGSCTVTSAGGCSGVFTIGQTCDPVEVVQFPGVNLVIPLGLPAPGGFGPVATNIQTVSGIPGSITDVDVDLVVQHTWAGDVKIDIEHLGTVVTAIELMGHLLPDADGCGTDNLNVIIDDEGPGGPIETQCSLTPPAAMSPPNYTPESAPGVPYTPGGLSAFDGMDPNGDWTISVSDGYDIDSGTLLSWSLHISYVGQVCQTGGCNCFGDLTGDGIVDGRDVKPFAACVAAGGASCPCGDMNHAGGATSADVAAFVTACLSGTCGP